jgi:ribonuclease Z
MDPSATDRPMIPNPPAKDGQLSFLWLPPHRVQGFSVAGEQTVVHVPELEVAFDVGFCPRVLVPCPSIALSHAHMDHIGGLPYWFSQRYFQKLPAGKVHCHHAIAQPLLNMMKGWVDLERQQTPHEVIGMEDGQEVLLKPNIWLRAIEVRHTVPALGFVVIERRNKLKPEFADLPADALREAKARGESITRQIDIPLVAYTGDTEMGPYLLRDEFRQAQTVVTECTFFDPEHRGRAATGMHLHVEDIRELLQAWTARDVVVVHLSRRTMLSYARKRLDEVGGEGRAHILMDHRATRSRYERQVNEDREASEARDGSDGAAEASTA